MNRLTLAIASVTAVLALVSGCNVGPDYKQPKTDLPDHFAATQPASVSDDYAVWWRTFNDPELDRLVDEAVDNNRTLRVAAARVREARAQRGVAASAYYPELNANGSYAHSRGSENVGLGS